MIPILSVMVEKAVSDTRFKLQEADYFLNQMKSNIDNKTFFIFNLIAFVSAGRSVTFVMQKQYKNGEYGPFSKWYVSNVQEELGRDENAVFFNSLRVKYLHQEGNPRLDIFFLY
jgi:hypothetical protein